jgi:hypothetical protein
MILNIEAPGGRFLRLTKLLSGLDVVKTPFLAPLLDGKFVFMFAGIFALQFQLTPISTCCQSKTGLVA